MDNEIELRLKKILSEPLQIEEDDVGREPIEQYIASLNEEQIIILYTRTRKAAGKSKRLKDMESLFLYVRACKTIQRIADEKNIVLTTDV